MMRNVALSPVLSLVTIDTRVALQRDEEIEILQKTHAQELKAVEFQLSTEQMQHQQAIQVTGSQPSR